MCLGRWQASAWCLQVDPAAVGEVSNSEAESNSTDNGSVSSGTNTLPVCLPFSALGLCCCMEEDICMAIALIAS